MNVTKSWKSLSKTLYQLRVGRYVGYCTPNPVILSGAKRSRRISSWLLRVDCLHGIYCVSCCSRKGGLSYVSARASLLTLCRERDSSTRNKFLAQNDNRGVTRRQVARCLLRVLLFKKRGDVVRFGIGFFFSTPFSAFERMCYNGKDEKEDLCI